MDWTIAFAGFGVGALVGMTGVGGGSLMTPLLVLLFGFAPTTSVGTDLWFAAITKLVGAAVHHKRGGIDWQVLWRLSLGSLPAAVLTLLWLHHSGAERIHQGTIVNALGGVILVTAFAILFKKRALAAARSVSQYMPKWRALASPSAMTVVAGTILGVLVTLTSVGGGALGVVMLMLLYPTRMKPAELVGTDIAHAIPLTLIAGTGHLMLGHVDFALLGQLLLGSIPGVVLGSLGAARAPETLIRSAIALTLMLAGGKLLAA
ncbi:sulfite exporter TauE/SafE family protein [Roseateles saccharophilus]|uniref:Probable membrane transporter protein n=1 Tax=Roseateles saccharophilus TaxID=304 RepID=A0A4R3UQA7_ROSSA|nr:sulfite exporter TauE/SafE family protein [Roseateles saccharophilus]MDG0833493.1 sulfite exporter TauE/SafE family protein [Roseateles saccharophilus]TCU92518.1 hypothetical protein EV671_102231 [Roseateles saccharophilus]